MYKQTRGVCLHFTFILTVLCNIISGQRLEILPAQPEQTKPIGKSLLLTCKSDISDPRAISELQWRDNKGRIVEKLMSVFDNYYGFYEGYGNKRNPTMYTEVLPDSGVTLYITSLTEEMEGKYTCTANYANTEPLSASVVVRTIYPIKWVDAPEKQYPIINKDYVVRCKVEANPAASINWLKDGESIITNDKYVIESNGLLIKNVQESDDGIYSCRAAVITTGELDTRYIKVEVQIPPIIMPMKPLEIIEGNTVSIQCNATGKPPPTYTWIKKSTKEDLSRTDRFSVNENTGLMVINRVAHDDNSDYDCVAKNSANETASTVRITVLMKPEIYELANITAPVNRSTTLICKARGRPAPMITFKKFGSPDYYVIGRQPGNDRIVLEQKIQEDESYGILTFSKLDRSDDGLYECKSENKAGKAWKNGHVTVEFSPSFASSAKQPPVYTWNNKPANLSCIAEAIPNATYEWRLNNIKIENSPQFNVINKKDRSFLIVNNYDSKYYNKYKCIATNTLGQAEHYVELKQAFPPQPVAQAKVLSLSATTIQFDIVGPPIFEGMPVKAFVVQYKEEREASWVYNIRNKTWSVDSPYILEYLEPEKTYVFRFAALNDVGLGDWGATQILTMSRRSAPNEPGILSTPEDGVVTSPYSDHFDLRWKIPADNGEPIELYQIKFCPVRRVNGDWVVLPDGCNTKELSGNDHPECSINPLNSDSYYKIELRAYNSIGFSTPAELIVKTARGSDTPVYKYDETTISSAAIIGIVIAAVLLLIIIVDLSCYCCNRAGILMAICEKTRKMPPDDEDPKLGRDEKEPLKTGDRTPMVSDALKKSSSVEYDGTRVSSRTGEIIGKNSAV